METNIVIGANFGDEGKGLITDFYASQKGKDCLVIRHNSGAQAGHSVTTKDGRRHVFGHIGAGSFAGAATYLSRFYVCNPLLFVKEYMVLEKICSIPQIFIDRQCLISTPYDIIINQMIEDIRGDNRHGSCGVGFGETIERNLHPQYALSVKDLDNLPAFLKRLLAIRHEWLPKRLTALGISKIPQHWMERIESIKLLEDYIDKTGFMLRTAKLVDGLPKEQFKSLVFEGAQGLMLDQDHVYFPHVTRSSTGIQNAFAVLDEAGLKEAKVTYVTRSYLTRHGAGPLPYELQEQPYKKIVDPTNLPNPYQGHLRFAWLELDLLAATIRYDQSFLPKHMKAEFGLAVSCIDQIDHLAGYIKGKKFHTSSVENFLNELRATINPSFMLGSYGPTRETMKKFTVCDTQQLVSAF